MDQSRSRLSDHKNAQRQWWKKICQPLRRIKTNKEVGSLVGPVRVFAVKLIALIPYYERDLIIIKRGGVYKYTNTREKR